MARSFTAGCCARFVEGRQSALSFALLVVGYVAYLIIGAGLFSAIELPYEHELRREMKAVRMEFLSNNTCVSEARLEKLLVQALEANNYGVSMLGNSTNRNWDFVSSLFFTSTVLTTTGEHISCNTPPILKHILHISPALMKSSFLVCSVSYFTRIMTQIMCININVYNYVELQAAGVHLVT